MTIPAFWANPARAAMLCALLAVAFSPLSHALDVPGNPRGTEVSQASVKWEWERVSGAHHYEVTVDGVPVVAAYNNWHVSQKLWAGEHSMSVKAVAADGRASLRSSTAKIVVRSQYDPAIQNHSELVVMGGSSVSDDGVDAAVSVDTPGAAADGTINTIDNKDPAAAPRPVPPAEITGYSPLVDPASLALPEAYQKPDHELVFSDEFNGSSINSTRWHTQLRWDGEFNGSRFEYRQINGEDQFYVNPLSSDAEHREKIATHHNPFEFNGSRLAIRAKRNPLQTHRGTRTHGSLMEMVSQQSFLSGALSTYDKFSQKYGYFEARIRIPSHVGTFPAFWLFHQQRAWEGTHRLEIDVMENLGHAPWYIYNTAHYFTGVSRTQRGTHHFLKPAPNGQVFTGIDYSRDYHVYAVDWEPGRVRWLIDGAVVSELQSPHVNYEALFVTLNLAMGGNWTNFPVNAGGLGRAAHERYPTADDLLPQNFTQPALEIDYIRVYRRR